MSLRDLRRYFVYFSLLLVLVFVVLSAMHAKSVTAIDIKVKDPATEYRDKSLLGLGKDNVLPDYKLKLRTTDGGWTGLGVKPNQTAAQWLSFPVRDNVPLRSALEIELYDSDKFNSDLLDRVQIGGTDISSQKYQYHLHTEYRFETGLLWFFNTALGKAIAGGITIAIIIVIVANWS
jgi:hypothetical protein